MVLRSLEAVAQRCSVKKFTNFTGKYLYRSFFFNKVESLRPANKLKDTPTQVLSFGCSENFKNTLF